MSNSPESQAPVEPKTMEQASDQVEVVQALVARVEALEAFRERIEHELTKTPEEPEPIQPPEEAESESGSKTEGSDVEELKRKYAQLMAQYETLEGEHLALKLRQESAAQAPTPPTPSVADMDISDDAVKAQMTALESENTKMRVELSKFKKTATAKFKRLQGDIHMVETQKKNLLRELATRDAGGGGGGVDLTLEQITDSPVFKTMLGNIRRTSREEVTLLHDAIASLKKIDPAAYKAVLPVVARTFEKANVENPLAMLPLE